ncbi:MAG: hypothetical protein DME57_00825 [Verrucomicrobia bacterium]|nr:MAG: hypothetical protein DME57_00825 [Verrucomicrobiota bacterium]
MVALIFLALGIVLSSVGRIMLIGAAFGVSVWWGLGIFLPFGPLLFRMTYPDLAPLSRTFRLFALPCFLAFFVLRPASISGSYTDNFFKHKDVPAAPADHYGLEKVSKPATPSGLEQRKIENAKEIERLTGWAESLHVRKRDLLRSDAEGNRAYNVEVAEYNAALAKATAEQKAIWPQVPQAAPAHKK